MPPASCLPQQNWSLGQLSRVRQWSGVEEECLGGAPVCFKRKRVDGLWSFHVESPSRSLAHLARGSPSSTPRKKCPGLWGLGHVLTSNWVLLKGAWGLQPFQSSLRAGGLLSAGSLCSMTRRLQASVLAKGAVVAWAEVRRTEQGCAAAALRWRRKDRR